MQQADVLHTLIAEGLAGGRIVRFRADGSSMDPAIRDGESIAVARVALEDVEPGDVLLCRHESRLLAHRVVGVTVQDSTRVFELRGDAKSASDAPMAADSVVGQVIGVWRNGLIEPVAAHSARVDSVYHRGMMRVRRAVRALADGAGWR
jgi:signal peptidase I